MTKDELLNQGIAAYKAGRREEARKLFLQTLQLDRNNEQAWMWLSGVVDTDPERRICLEKVLALNPNNAIARRGLEHLQALAPEPVASEPVVTPEPPVTSQVTPISGLEELAPAPPVPDIQPVPPEGIVETEDKPAKRDIGFWVFVGVVGVMLCLFGSILLAILGSLGGEASVEPTDSPSVITSVVYENIAAHNAEDVERYMATLHSDSPNYDNTREILQEAYRTYDIEHTITGVELLESSNKKAEVASVLTTKKIRGPSFHDNRVTGVYILRKEDGQWKLYDQKVDDIEYLE